MASAVATRNDPTAAAESAPRFSALPQLLVQVCAVMALHLGTACLVRKAAWWQVLVAAYALGGTYSQNLFTAQHELSHFLAFKRPLYNRILSLASNCPLVVPMATTFRKYHQEHHSHLVWPLCCLLCTGTAQPGCATPFAQGDGEYCTSQGFIGTFKKLELGAWSLQRL